MAALSVGVIGIGAFGSRVALRLLWNGFHTLQLYDVNDISTRQFTNDYGGMLTGSPKMMAQTCDAVITVLPSAAELREVCFGWENLAKGFSSGGIVINLGIVDALEIVAIARELKERGVTLIDAPAFGTPGAGQGGQACALRRRRGGGVRARARRAGDAGAERRAHRRGRRAAGARRHRRLCPRRGTAGDMRSAAAGSALWACARRHLAHGRGTRGPANAAARGGAHAPVPVCAAHSA